jgi:uncharacterized RDD family membrane protein YckC
MENGEKSLQSKENEVVKIAGFWRRVTAFVLDGFILSIIGFILSLLYRPVLPGVGALGRAIGFIIALIYLGLMNSKIANGQSVGKKLMKIKVVNKKGEYISPLKSFSRTAILILPFFLNGWMLPYYPPNLIIVSLLGLIVFGAGGIIIYLFIFNKETRQSLHDLACGTYVVREKIDGVIIAREFPKMHYIFPGVLLISILIYSFIIEPNIAKKGFMPELFEALEELYKKENIWSAEIYIGQSGFPGQTTKYVSSTIILKEEPESGYSEAENIAKFLLESISEAKEKDMIFVTLSYGFDLGIAASWSSQNFSFSTAELLGEDSINAVRP